jgi:acetylornithine deacetylase/succinyl-diaminopimelate desuccinylase-like protein
MLLLLRENIGDIIWNSYQVREVQASRGLWTVTFQLGRAAAMLAALLTTSCVGLTLQAQVATPGLAVSPLEPAEQQLARAILQELIAIDTSHAGGSTSPAAEAMRQRFIQAGFPEADISVVGMKDDRKNLVVRYRAAASTAVGEKTAGAVVKKPVLLMGHLDVVNAPRAEWTVEPFRLVETEGYFYGRGTQDMKNSDAAWVASFLLLKQAGFVPKRDLILALTADEEGGGDNGIEWLVKNRRDLVDAAFAVNPDAGGLLLDDGRPVELDLEATEKVYADYVLTATSPGGHSSRPLPGNALYLVADALGRIERDPFPIELNPTTRAYLEAEARRESAEKRKLISQILKPKMDADSADRLALDPGYNAILRTTCVGTMMQAGEAENALPGFARANVNCRILPGHSPEEVRKRLSQIVSDVRVKVQYRSEGGELKDSAPDRPAIQPPPLTQEVMQPLRAVAAAMWSNIRIVPEMEPGSTDSVYTAGAGIPTYGFSGMGIDLNDNRAHGRDERLRTSSFYTGVQFMREIVRQIGME